MKTLLLAVLLVPSLAMAYTNPNEMPTFASLNKEERQAVLEKAIYMEEERFERLVEACLASYAEPGRSYNDGWHRTIEQKSIDCANNLERLTDNIEKSSVGKGSNAQ